MCMFAQAHEWLHFGHVNRHFKSLHLMSLSLALASKLSHAKVSTMAHFYDSSVQKYLNR